MERVTVLTVVALGAGLATGLGRRGMACSPAIAEETSRE